MGSRSTQSRFIIPEVIPTDIAPTPRAMRISRAGSSPNTTTSDAAARGSPMEATAIAFAQQGMVPARPLTHDLMRDVLEALNVQLKTVNITPLRDGIFFADLIFSNGKEVSARPSDSIALALRTGATIFASEEILDEAGVAIPDEQEDEVEKFREFLDTITPEDFGRST